ncbi:MAG TPA: hypothetical protein VFH39_01480 [Candidatus Saccharimonadales bacterium]|nr:hypothetical protein [Candidatus Saccharimonadales bacterium]
MTKMLERPVAETAELTPLEAGARALVTLYFQRDDTWVPADRWSGEVRPNPQCYEADDSYVNVLPDEPRGTEPYGSRHPRLMNRTEPFRHEFANGEAVWLRYGVELDLPRSAE